MDRVNNVTIEDKDRMEAAEAGQKPDAGSAAKSRAKGEAAEAGQKPDAGSAVKSRAEGEVADQAKTAFLFSMSHDIRTPLNAIMGLARLAQNHLEEPDVVGRYLKEITLAGDQLFNIVNRVLEITRIESKQVDILNENTDTKEIYDGLVAVIREQIRERDLHVTYRNELEHRWLYMDRTHMEQILLNIIENAIDYTPDGGHIKVRFRSLPGKDEKYTLTQIQVEDDGIGMSEEFQGRIFQEFAREQDATNSGIQGSGLGLTIVKKLVDMMNGSIRIDSKKGVGTCVTIEMSHKIGYVPRRRKGIHAYDDSVLEGKRILLAEDIDVNALIAEEILSSKGILVDRAHDGQECVNMLMNAPDGHYDTILMDIQMPKMNGYQATEAIRNLRDKAKSGIPIIALTANTFVEDRIRALSVGMNSHVGKPIDIDTLFETIYNAFTFKNYYVNNAELSQFKEKYQQLGCPCGYFVYRADREERIIGANVATAEIFGCSDSDEFLEYVDSSFRGMVHPDDLDEIEREIAMQQDSSDNGIDNIAYRIIRKDGVIRNVVDIGYKAFDGKDVLYYVYIADVTEVEK